MTSTERFTILYGGPSSEERDDRMTAGADDLAVSRGRAGLFGNERILLTVAAGLMTFGVCMILLGWYGAANTVLFEEQVPYLISGGLLGTALATIGGMCLLAHWHTVQLREARTRDEAHRQDVQLLLEAIRGLGGTVPSVDGRAPQRPVRRRPVNS